VATDVGDIKWLFGQEDGHYICEFNEYDLAQKILNAIDYRERFGMTRGRERIISLGLDSASIARRILKVYEFAVQ
jgi:hypothetical protein